MSTPDRPPIENTLRPETVNEVLLLNRIRELQIKLYEKRAEPFDLMSPVPVEVSVPFPVPHDLRLMARWEAGWEECRGLHVRGQATGKDGFGVGYYVSEQMLRHSSLEFRAQILGEEHQRVIRQLAKFVEKHV